VPTLPDLEICEVTPSRLGRLALKVVLFSIFSKIDKLLSMEEE
jgi:hypothetical protein